MKIIPLGTNGFFPSFGRETACYAVPFKNTLILLDAGSGFFRLAGKEGQKLLKKAREVHIFLSHYHLDHTFGFYAAFELLKDKKVTVLAPTARKVFSEFPPLGYFPINYSIKHKNFRWQKLTEGTHKISSYKVKVKEQNHRREDCLAFRFDFGLTYLTDAKPTRGNIEFMKNTPLLLHEHWFSGEELDKIIDFEKQIIDGHTTTIGAALFAKEAEVGKLVLIHHHPLADNKKLEDQFKLARSIFPRIELACDLHKIPFSS